MLIVDDHEDMRLMTRLGLQVSPIDIVGEAVNGREALEMVEDLTPQIVVMDMMMPEMNGVTATREIRARFPDVTVLGFTASGDDSVEDMVQAGADAVFEKNRFPEMISHIREWAE